MCYSAMVEQHLRLLAREFRAEVDWDSFETLFRERLTHGDIKVARALEANFTEQASPSGESDIERPSDPCRLRGPYRPEAWL